MMTAINLSHIIEKKAAVIFIHYGFMKLKLEVVSFKNQLVTDIDAVFINNTSGTIGRADDNALVLPDAEKFVSRHHVTIRFENDCYYLSDTSTGGTYINNREMQREGTERIDSGMVLRIGEYEIAVTIEAELKSGSLFHVDESEFGLDHGKPNSLMTDDFPRHEELLPLQPNEPFPSYQSGLGGNRSPLVDFYPPPVINPPSAAVENIPENFGIDDLFSESELTLKTESKSTQEIGQATVDKDFEALIAKALGDMVVEVGSQPQENDNTDDSASCGPVTVGSGNNPQSPLPATHSTPIATAIPVIGTSHENEKQVLHYGVLFNAFLQGAGVKGLDIRPEQLTEAMCSIGQMFRKLIGGTVAVLRSRAEFKSLCRVNMTVIRATDNNPLKFTVSTDDVLRQLLENKTDGFLEATTAIEESFNDIMDHQLAMQAGIQASLTDLLKTFDPKVIEKQFEQGIVLQKKAKCWDKYEETYQDTVDYAVDNFFGDEFVRAYEEQMNLLKKSRRK